MAIRNLDLSGRGSPVPSPTPKVLIVEDDYRIAAFIQRALSQAGYQVKLAIDGPAALAAAEAEQPDIVVLDVMLPGLDGLEVARRLRAGGGVPILMLTARDAIEDRVMGLDAGADDYLIKPFALEELLARLRALLRRQEVNAAERKRGTLTFSDIVLDQDAHEAVRGGHKLELRNMEYELLAFFLRHPGRVLSRREIFEEVWDFDFLGDSNVIEVTLGHLRQKLEAEGEPRVLHTVRSAGYVMREEVAAQ
ncbi:MAG: response regulator transcription factor [Chloroflexi bacterium]|nr:response regulator transcription factor [Chloroflexota bacterium]